MNENINQYVVVVDPPPEYPVTLQEARLQCKVDADENSPESHPDDALLELLIREETQALDSKDGWLGRALITQTLDLVLDRFPCNKIVLPFPPLQQVIFIRYIDTDGAEQEMEAASGSPPSGGDYRVVDDAEPAYIEPAYGTAWPATRGTASVRVRFIAGYGPAEFVPDTVKQYMLHKIAYRYEYREAASMGLVMKNPYIEHMLDNLRVR